MEEIIKIESGIHSLMNTKNGVTIHFKNNGVDTLSLITYNRVSSEFFLVKTFIDTGEGLFNEEARPWDERLLTLYIKMLEYVKELIRCIGNNTPTEKIGNSYTVMWNKNNAETIKSYFYGTDIQDVLSKFYFGKESIKHMFNILEIKLNPIS